MVGLEQGPLSDAELDELEQFLLDAEGIDDSMGLSTIDGFLTAIVSGPRTIMPSEWLPWVWDAEHGERSPVFANQKEAQRVLELLMRHMNGIARTLLDAPDQFEPLIEEHLHEDDRIPVIDDWCSGYVAGMSLDPDGWQPVIKSHPEWLSTILLYGTEAGWKLQEEAELSLEAHKALAAGLADAACTAHAFFLAQRRQDAAAGSPPETMRNNPPIRRGTKVGRNEACPCGSGRKYKHCHGKPNQLH